ncbi:ATP-binding cassette domain-containing protein [Rhodobacterales bacterium HKCCE2091]|nr:ATP-binding cassette domain-containing protein [Rhodobacterales bacterium HKCCE2091]
MTAPVLTAEDLGKRFKRREGPTTLLGTFAGRFSPAATEAFWALRHVSFAVAEGEMLGVIGSNGSGKTTLLRCLSQVLRPDEGHVSAAHPVNGLLDLNAGMHNELTGRENLFISGSILGLLMREIHDRYDSIVDFAELGHAIDQPLRTYSAGMKLRLGFSVAIHADPKILLVDEVLAVGDLAFQTKCLDRIREMKQAGMSIVLISHDLGQIEGMCDRALWLRRGALEYEGPPRDAVAAYRAGFDAASAALTPTEAVPDAGQDGLRLGDNRIGSMGAVVSDVRLTGPSADPGGIPVLRPGDPLRLTARISRRDPALASAHFHVGVAAEDGTRAFEFNSATDGHEIVLRDGDQPVSLFFDRLDLAPGRYLLTVGLLEADWTHALDLHRDAYPFEIADGPNGTGPLSPPRNWSFGEV